MSGFEVLGIVLGTIPLLVSALEHYQKGLNSIRRWQSYEAELQSLKRKLGNENAIFLNTCQQLLSGIVGSVDHEKLVDEPFGELWSSIEIRDRIALRLDHVYEPFKATVVAMDVALREIKAKLSLDELGQVKWTEGKAIVREIKRATFTTRRSQFDDQLNGISKNNEYLKILTNQSIQLEPGRRVKYHGRLFSQLKEVSRSAYRANQRLEDPLDLCKLVRKGKHGLKSECFGVISNSTSQRYPKFGVYSQSEHSDHKLMISLEDVLEDAERTFPGVSYADRLKLAVDISSGVLQLITTSWLPEKITSRDIIFPIEDGCPVYGQAFIVKNLSDPADQYPVTSQALHMQALETTMFSLGLLLLEIHFFETLDYVRDTKIERSTSKATGQFSDRKAATELLSQVQTLGSPKFYSAVRRFLFCEFTCLDFTLGDEAFCKEVYGKTIALLEEDFQLSYSL
ncbi:hypothetical protein AB5N19_13600 [Seiridium cardinale]